VKQGGKVVLTGRYTTEEISPGEYHVLSVESETLIQQTKFSKIEVLETKSYGRGLFLDGRLQNVQGDEYVFNEAMVHPAMFFLKERCKTALLIGGGPGGQCRELLKYAFVKKVYHVEIDPVVVEVSRKYFTHVSRGCWDDPRCELVIRDAFAFLEETPEIFDLIICDVSEPHEGSPANSFFSEDGLKLIHRKLNPETGLYVTWAGPANPRSMELTTSVMRAISKVFPVHHPYYIYTHTFGTSWISTIATNRALDPLGESPQTIDEYLAKQNLKDLGYYDGVTHYNMFHIPKNARVKLT
jgi:spermidine synthase